ncbi:iron chelate uptake ABC transporter family permease subunit [Brevibacillus centrosporus]|uniref:iron chelate uptake ABC transporter family permease subunit n=1 Tax=Brevibacillus centrosporus TaxID=54910 RepID=UPI000F0A70E5|nr:iron chelate uptake ABC transporter family permease subunit [Brevibacillus centrosporus]MEC2127520.1 iron chelate uptake ABC transporter family permease subunit [Brevibacillus centrosporus]MED4910506.1 iron chelate uptake ABC transporter family permease subunit [Brevibacillus centrosporus]RNB67853.1 iron ABC transporter permease [Brevibacillus centrosporus]GED30170.1 putative ABC transporter permease protein YclO [Brevibacillus centrosporus]
MKAKIIGLTIVAIVLIAIFMMIDAGGNWDYVLPRRLKKILAIVLTGSVIAFSTLVFQTITNNRILTPSIIGLDSLYMFIQTLVIFALGSTSLTLINKNVNFLISVVLMILFAGLLYKWLFKREGQNIYFLLLIGLIFGTLFNSLSTFLQLLIDPNEFLRVQDKMFASFNNVNTDLLIISFVLIIAVGIYFWKYIKYLDVMSLGRDQAINLGVNYDFVVKRFLIIIAILVSISTALVGPITFLGLLVVNVAHQFMKTYQHKHLIVGSALISIIALVGGLLIVERVFTFSTTLSVIVNFIGGAYFIYLLLKENKSW